MLPEGHTRADPAVCGGGCAGEGRRAEELIPLPLYVPYSNRERGPCTVPGQAVELALVVSVWVTQI